jgi:threonyl-tRNA synthetase
MNKEELDSARHTLAHLLAAAVVDLYPHAKPTLGPAIDTGFYYDFDFGDQEKPSAENLKKIEQKMREFLKKWETILPEQVTEKQARKLFEKNPYKLEMIDEIVASGEPISVYNSGEAIGELSTKTALFFDLCGGGHVSTPNKDLKNIGFTLDRIAGAYWRGDEKNTMLTRIYGLAFEDKETLNKYELEREEAKKRDHRKLGKELDLFTFSELVGSGLPLWTPHGTILRHELDSFVWELRAKQGYSRVVIPHITKKSLYEKSGHWEKFGDELFKVVTREGKQYALKPMNCPHHTQIFARKPHSYREMPQRYAETTMVYRDEQSGELGGLTRVLSITQDDSHVFCRRSQVKEEFMRIWDIVNTLYSTFDFTLRTSLSFHDPNTMEKYLGDSDIWNDAEEALKEIAEERKADYFIAVGEAAMYGPKMDFLATDSLGREHQVATIQLDFNLPERFDLSCVNEDGKEERVVMIHAAIMGSIERFSAVLIEHLNGYLPLWVSPVQVRVLPVADAHTEYAQKIQDAFSEAGIRSEYKSTAESFGKRVRACKVAKLPYYICVGDEEVSSQCISLETPDGTKVSGTVPELVSFLQKKIKERT